MNRMIFVRPLKPNVAADNGARTFLPPRGMVREASPYFERLRQIGAAELLDLPAPGQRVMIRPADGNVQLARSGQVMPWDKTLEAQLTDGLISFPEPEPGSPPEDPQEMAEDRPPGDPVPEPAAAPPTHDRKDDAHG